MYRSLFPCQRTVGRQSLVALVFGAAALLSTASALAAADGAVPDERSAMRLPAVDPRTAVPLAGEDRAYVLGQMRLFLAGIQRISAALGENDLALAAKVAAITGARNNDTDPSRPADLRARQPAAWNQYIGLVRRGFDDIANTAATAPVQDSLKKLGALTQNCVACHQTFQIVDGRGAKSE